MQRKILVGVLLAVCLSVSAPANAMLIGDTVRLSHRFPAVVNVIEGYFVEVTGDNTDQRIFGSYFANPQNDQILFDFFRPFSYANSNPFEGHVVDFIDDSLASVTVDTNLFGWDDSLMSFGDHAVQFNWSGLSGQGGTYFYASLAFEDDNSKGGSSHGIPEPMSIFLLSTGLVFFSIHKKKLP